MKVLGVIPARLGSKGVPSKNVRELGEKLVIEYTILDALAAKQLDMVAVTSDDPRVQEICEKYKEVCFVSRPVALAGNTARIDDVMRHCSAEVSKRSGFKADAVALLYGNVPVRAEGIIDKAIEHLEKTGADSVQTLSPVGKFHPYWLYNMEGDRISKYVDNQIYRRQELPPVYAIDSAVGVMRIEGLEAAEDNSDPHAFWGRDRRGFSQEPHDTVDIDTFRDFLVAEAALREKAEI